MAIPEHPMGYKDFRRHWLATAWNKAWGIFSVARGWNEVVRAIVTLIAAAFAAYGGVEATKSRVVFVSVLWWFAVIPFGMLILSFFWHFPKAPHEIYLGLEQKRKNDVAGKQEEIKTMSKALAETEARIESDDAKAARKKAIGNGLGDFVIKLQNVRREIDAIFYIRYEEQIMKEKDAEIIAIINAMLAWLDANLGLGYAAIMRDLRPKQMPEDTTWDRVSQQKRMQEMQLNFLDAYISQLKTILHDYLAK
jgi:hypothetical protein